METPKAKPVDESRVSPEALAPEPKPQAYYDDIKTRFAEERDLRLKFRPEGTAQFTSDLTGELAKYEIDPYAAVSRRC